MRRASTTRDLQKELTMRSGIDRRVLSFVLLSGLAVVACGGGAIATGTPTTTTAASPTPSQVVATLKPSASLAASASPSPSASSATVSPTPLGGTGGSNSPLALDPCQLLTTEQASAVNVITYAAGVSHVMGSGGVECVWQSKSPPASVTVQVAVFPSVSEAEIAYAEQTAGQNGFAVEPLTGFADDAAIARASGAGLSTGGIYVRDGSTFFDVVYLNGTAPTDDQLKGFATTILGELPAAPGPT
jgi:hypothetical protein